MTGETWAMKEWPEGPWFEGTAQWRPERSYPSIGAPIVNLYQDTASIHYEYNDGIAKGMFDITVKKMIERGYEIVYGYACALHPGGIRKKDGWPDMPVEHVIFLRKVYHGPPYIKDPLDDVIVGIRSDEV